MANFGYQLANLQTRITDLQEQHNEIRRNLMEATVFTSKMLAEAEKLNMKMVSVNTYHKDLDNAHWFKAVGLSNHLSGHMFSQKSDKDTSGWPTVWRLVGNLGISGGAGNSGQHQANTSQLIDGVYKFENGNWERLNDGDEN